MSARAYECGVYCICGNECIHTRMLCGICAFECVTGYDFVVSPQHANASKAWTHSKGHIESLYGYNSKSYKPGAKTLLNGYETCVHACTLIL